MSMERSGVVNVMSVVVTYHVAAHMWLGAEDRGMLDGTGKGVEKMAFCGTFDWLGVATGQECNEPERLDRGLVLRECAGVTLPSCCGCEADSQASEVGGAGMCNSS